jgi:CheY-like chemotaxis protein
VNFNPFGTDPPDLAIRPLSRAQWRQAVLTELAEPGYIDLAPVRDEESKIVDFAPTEVTSTAAKLLGLYQNDLTPRPLAQLVCAEGRRHLLDACRSVAYGGGDVAVSARRTDGHFDSVVVHKMFATEASVSVVLTCPTAIAKLRDAQLAVQALDPHVVPNDAEPVIRVLVVDDNVDAATTMCDWLDILGYETAVAFSGPESLGVAARFNPHLSFIDFDMPGMDGCEALRQLRLQDSDLPQRFVCLTARADMDDKRRCQAAGFDDFITKPIAAARLAQVLAEVSV